MTGGGGAPSLPSPAQRHSPEDGRTPSSSSCVHLCIAFPRLCFFFFVGTLFIISSSSLCSRGSCCGTVVSDRRTHWRKVDCISLIGWLAQTQRVDSNLTSHSWILSIVTIATGILGGSGGLLIMLWDFRTLCIIIRFVTAAIRMQVSIACNMGGGGGGGGASEHQLKERRAAANTSSAPICQVKVRAEPSERNTLLGHAHMKEALGRYSNMKYRWGSESDTKRWSCDPTGAERDSGSCFIHVCVCVCVPGVVLSGPATTS